MNARKLFVGMIAVGTLGVAVVVGKVSQPAGVQMADAAEKLLAGLPEEIRAKAKFAFDDAERINWHFIPRERKGAVLKSMNDAQKDLVKGLLRAGMSKEGYDSALAVMSLEGILRAIEDKAGTRRFPRDPELYFVSVFGEPAKTGSWGWRIEGHHLSLNFTIKDGTVVAATPTVFAANPARVPEGPKEGLRTLPREEDVARRLYSSLSGEAKKQATIAPSATPDFAEVVTGQQNAKPNKTPVVGVRHADLTEDQKVQLRELMQVYLGKYAADVAAAMLEQAEKAGLDDIRFAWAGPAEPGKQHYYRVQGPTFIIEYCNVQNNGNHIHSLWRSAKADFAAPAGD